MKKTPWCSVLSFFYFLPLAAGKIAPSSSPLAPKEHIPHSTIIHKTHKRPTLHALSKTLYGTHITSDRAQTEHRLMVASWIPARPTSHDYQTRLERILNLAAKKYSAAEQRDAQRILNLYCDGFAIDELVQQQQKEAALSSALAKLSLGKTTISDPTLMPMSLPDAPPPSPFDESEAISMSESTVKSMELADSH